MLASLLYRASTVLVLWQVAAFVRLLPDRLSLPPVVFILAVATWLLAVWIEYRSNMRADRRAAETAVALPASEPQPVAEPKPAEPLRTQPKAALMAEPVTSVPEPKQASRVDQAIDDRARRKRDVERTLDDESAIWPELTERAPEESFAGREPIVVTFELFRWLPTMVLTEIQDRLNETGPHVVPAQQPGHDPDSYHVRTDGPRYDLQTLRSV